MRIRFMDVFVRSMRTGTLWKGVIVHIGVGLCVARSTISGNAKASVRGTGDGSTPTLFYAAKSCTNNNHRLFFGVRGMKTN